MRNIFKTVDMDQVKDQISDIKDQVQDIRLRTPWTREGNSSGLVFLGLGAAAAVAGIVLYLNRKKVATFCADCGANLKEKLENSPLKEKAGKIMDKMNGTLDTNGSRLENYQPT